MTPIETAHWWVRHGLAVFPLIPKSKSPAVATGFLAATLDNKKVDEWWTRKPQCGVGVAVPEGIIVTDFDALAHEHLSDTLDMEIPETFHTCTPGDGGGKHFWWKLPVGVVIPPMVKVMPGLDIRTKGSYVVSPPSEHPDGGVYTWGDVDSETFNVNDLPLCPAWILEACVTAQLKSTSGDQREKINVLSMLHGINPGARQVGLFRAACSMRERGFEREEALVILEGIAKASEGTGYKKWPNLKALVTRVWKRYERTSRSGTCKVTTLSDLMAMDLGDVHWFVDDFLGPGLGLMWADEKVGKSAAAANLAISLATREKVWGRFVVPKVRGVLYLDLEQGQLFGQRRWRKILDGRTPPSNLRVAWEWPRMDAGGLDELKRVLDINEDIDLVVIDIWSLFKPTTPPPGHNAYDMDNYTLAELKKIANQYGICVMLIHHTNKSGEYSGSKAMGGAQDYMFELSREDGSRVGMISTKGKNVPARKLYCDVDLGKFHWKVTGEE